MSPTVSILLLWIGFGGTHIGLSSVPVRQWIVQRVGEDRFRGLYSLVALSFFIALVWTYFRHKHAGPVLWTLPHGAGLRWIVYLGMGLAFVLLAASFARPPPAGVPPGDPTPQGAHRLARHPLFAAFAIFGLMHLLPNGTAADVVFFGGFVLFALVGGWHQDQRKLAMAVAGYRQFCEGTPFLPFTGRETLRGVRELSPVVIGIGIAITFALRYFHRSWFGG